MMPSNKVNVKLNLFVSVVLYCVCLCFTQPVPGTNLGSNCTVEPNITGTCKQLKDCPRSINLNKTLLDCSNENVCCPNLGDISEQKCNEYGKYVIENYNPEYHYTKLPGLIFVAEGQDANPGEFPHMALLGYGNEKIEKWICGGSLISYQHVLTAAHCSFHAESNSSINWVRLGEHNQSEETNPNRIDIKIKQFIKHPLYKRKLKYHDIAIVLLDKRVTFSENIWPACLTTNPIFESNTKFIATGWGSLDWSNNFADVLQKVKLEEFSKNDCQQKYNLLYNIKHLPEGINNSFICAGDKFGGKDTCGGDSGGPLQVYHQKMKYMYSVVGITAFGKSLCGQAGVPGVYTKVYDYIEWIENLVWV